jgi:hypothetical protein
VAKSKRGVSYPQLHGEAFLADFTVPLRFRSSILNRGLHQPTCVKELRLAQPRSDQLQTGHGHLVTLQRYRERQRRVARKIHGRRILQSEHAPSRMPIPKFGGITSGGTCIVGKAIKSTFVKT